MQDNSIRIFFTFYLEKLNKLVIRSTFSRTNERKSQLVPFLERIIKQADKIFSMFITPSPFGGGGVSPEQHSTFGILAFLQGKDLQWSNFVGAGSWSGAQLMFWWSRYPEPRANVWKLPVLVYFYLLFYLKCNLILVAVNFMSWARELGFVDCRHTKTSVQWFLTFRFFETCFSWKWIPPKTKISAHNQFLTAVAVDDKQWMNLFFRIILFFTGSSFWKLIWLFHYNMFFSYRDADFSTKCWRVAKRCENF